MDWYQLGSLIGGVILAILTGAFGVKWASGKSKAKQIADIILEALAAVEDQQLSPEELKSLFAKVTALLGLSGEEVRAKVQMKRKARMKK